MAAENLNIDICLENISRQLENIIIPPPSEYEGSEGGFSSVRVSLLDFALGRPWNSDDTVTVFTRIEEFENDVREWTDYEREVIMHHVISEYLLENQMVVGPEWYTENFDDLYVEIQELYDTWNSERLLESDEIIGAGGLSSEIITKNLKTRVCGINVDGDEVCPICCDQFCQEEDKKIGVINCGHEYHVKCIEEWLQKNNICPLCRAQGLERT